MAAKPDPKEPVTRETLDEAVNAILTGVGHMVNELRQEVVEGFKQADGRFEQVEAHFKGIEVIVKDEGDGLKAELSDKVTRKEFDMVKRELRQLQHHVAQHHPLN